MANALLPLSSWVIYLAKSVVRIGGQSSIARDAASAVLSCLSPYNSQARLFKHRACSVVQTSCSGTLGVSSTCLIPSLWRPSSRFTSGGGEALVVFRLHYIRPGFIPLACQPSGAPLVFMCDCGRVTRMIDRGWNSNYYRMSLVRADCSSCS